MTSGDYAGFILASYAFAFLVVLCLAGAAILDHRAQRAALDRLERAGIRRRSAQSEDTDQDKRVLP